MNIFWLPAASYYFEKPIYEYYNDIHSKSDVKRRIGSQCYDIYSQDLNLQYIHLEHIACCTCRHNGDRIIIMN